MYILKSLIKYIYRLIKYLMRPYFFLKRYVLKIYFKIRSKKNIKLIIIKLRKKLTHDRVKTIDDRVKTIDDRVAAIDEKLTNIQNREVILGKMHENIQLISIKLDKKLMDDRITTMQNREVILEQMHDEFKNKNKIFINLKKDVQSVQKSVQSVQKDVRKTYAIANQLPSDIYNAHTISKTLEDVSFVSHLSTTFSISTSFAAYLLQYVRKNKISSVIEFGSGLSTKILAELFSNNKGRLESYDFDPAYIEGCTADGTSIGAVKMATSNTIENLNYDIFDLVFIDGPSTISNPTAGLDLFSQHASAIAKCSHIIVDDCHRPAEIELCELICSKNVDLDLEFVRFGNKCAGILEQKRNFSDDN
ncbi:MAG: hypothetical protein ABJK39_14465 [Hyphomicrobiales bacterium]